MRGQTVEVDEDERYLQLPSDTGFEMRADGDWISLMSANYGGLRTKGVNAIESGKTGDEPYKPAAKAKAKLRKSIHEFAAFTAEPEPERKKKRKLGGFGKTLFDEEEDASSSPIAHAARNVALIVLSGDVLLTQVKLH